MHRYRALTLASATGVLGALVITFFFVSYARKQTAAPPATIPAGTPVQASAKPSSSDKDNTPFMDPFRVQARSVMFVLGYGAYKYKKEHGDFPKSLTEMVAKQEDLLDPWGRPYHYDPVGAHNNREVPDIWSDGADPSDPRAILVNWEDGAD